MTRSFRSMDRRTRSVAAAALAGSAALALATSLMAPASGTGTNPPQPPQYVPAGYLTLATGTADRVALDRDANGTPERTQELKELANCLLGTDGAKPAASGSLLAIDGLVSTTGGKASFLGNSIGVAEKKSGTSCYQVGAPAESLVLRLNPENVRGSFGALLASSAYLDVELKQSSRILATATRGGEVVGRFELQSGATRGTTTALPGGVSPDEVFQCTGASDSAPDAGISDNCRWPISAPSWLGTADDGRYFDMLTLQAINGSFSLEGGADGNVPGPAGQPTPPQVIPGGATVLELAELVDGTLACEASTETEPGSTTAPEVTVRRLDNAAPVSDPCELIPYTLTNLLSAARFLKPLDQQKTAQFVFTMVWTLPASAPLPLPITQVDYETADPRTTIPLGWCPDPIFTDGVLDGIADPLGNPAAVDQDDALDGKQFSCLGSQNAQVVPGDPDTVRLVEQIYVLGDVFLRK